MSRLASPDVSELSETKALRDRRQDLLRRARYCLHRRPDLAEELKQATNDLLRREIEARKKPKPLGDAGAVGKRQNGFDFYKD